jgi:hypothetical protein
MNESKGRTVYYNKDLTDEQVMYALERVAKHKIVFDRLSENVWRVSSSSKSGWYKVTLNSTRGEITVEPETLEPVLRPATTKYSLRCECPGRGYNSWCYHEILVGEFGLDASIKPELAMGTSFIASHGNVGWAQRRARAST